MIHFLLLTVSLLLSSTLVAQSDAISSRQLEVDEVNSVFSDSLKESLDIQFGIYRAYEYTDQVGTHYLVMTENRKALRKEEFDAIRAYCFLKKDQEWNLEWQFWDFILTEGNEVGAETSINHWTKYFHLDDYDGDGLADPILVYGTFNEGSADDGRIKILVYQNNQKFAIRHQNGSLDFLRNTKVDASFYYLPEGIQNRVKEIMETIVENNHAIFPYGWEEAMENQQTYFDEN